MLFNSLLFLLIALPVAWVGHALVIRLLPGARLASLLLLSFVFYGWWDVRFVPLLALSVGVNWGLAGLFVRTGRGGFITAAIVLDLLLLAGYKYLDFLFETVNLLPGADLPHLVYALPLGLSFFTFQHIAYLNDVRADRTAHVGLGAYALYVAFFPKVIAGPLVRAAEFMPQVLGPARPVGAEVVARALALLTLGLAKKVFLGDTLGATVDPIYRAVAGGAHPTGIESWAATLGYTLQLYFDFSGYTDMALGLALLFGIRLPQNFETPYRATSIQDFWRRWHITLSLFLRDYLYIPFGGNRHGLTRQVAALFATMVLGGLWHGAGWTFVLWGALHGAALGGHLLWRKAGRSMPAPAGWGLTIAFVALAWIPFRAPGFAEAGAILLGLTGQGSSRADQVPAEFWPLLAAAFVLATAGPTAFELSQRLLRPARWAAVALALLLAAVLVKVGDDANLDFIYAQF